MASPGRVSAGGGRVVYEWDATLEEWYVNDRRGLEHGYTVLKRAPRDQESAGSPLTFTLAVRGELRPEVTGFGRSVRFQSDNSAHVSGSAYAFVISIGDSICQSNANSTGMEAHISASGSDVAGAGNSLTLTSEPVPDEPGIFFCGSNPIRVPFGNGFLCVGESLVRILPPATASGNSAAVTIDNGAFRVGHVLYFQHWFRDPAGGGAFFNTSDGLSVAFVR